MDKLKAFESFVSVATRGSLTAAAKAEGVAPAIMGRRLDALEEHPFGLTECSANSGTCNLETGCRIRDSWMRINTVVRQALQIPATTEMTARAGAHHRAHLRAGLGHAEDLNPGGIHLGRQGVARGRP